MVLKDEEYRGYGGRLSIGEEEEEEKEWEEEE